MAADETVSERAAQLLSAVDESQPQDAVAHFETLYELLRSNLQDNQ